MIVIFDGNLNGVASQESKIRGINFTCTFWFVRKKKKNTLIT